MNNRYYYTAQREGKQWKIERHDRLDVYSWLVMIGGILAILIIGRL